MINMRKINVLFIGLLLFFSSYSIARADSLIYPVAEGINTSSGANINNLGTSGGTPEFTDDPEDYINQSTYEPESCKTNGSCLGGAQGIRFRILYYSGNGGDAVEVPGSKPIEIINPGMLGAVTFDNGVATPSTYAGVCSGSGLTQILSPTTVSGADNWLNNGGVAPPGEDGNGSLRTQDVTGKGENGQDETYSNMYSYQYSMANCNRIEAGSGYLSKDSLPYGNPGDVNFMFTYMSGYTKTYYPGIGGPPGAIEDPEITKNSIAGDYFQTLLSKYVYVSIDSINSLYSVHLSEKDIDNYYIEAQGIYRVFDPPQFAGNFLIRSISHRVSDPDIFTSSSGDIVEEEKGHAASCSKKSSPPKGCKDVTCSLPGCDSSCCNEEDDTRHKEWSHGDHACGILNYHRILGKYFVGSSHLEYTASAPGQSCNPDPDVIGGNLVDIIDESDSNGRVRHCKNQTSTEYVQSEKVNECPANEYEYYIGPNQEHALIGTTSASTYNLYGTKSGGGYTSKCRYGVKHFFVMDSVNESNVCLKICENSGSKDSDTYLKCAENYCENDVDYSLGGSPFIRKRKCVLEQCGYEYGKEPIMKDASNKKYKQSVSNCPNSTIFKKQAANTKYTSKSYYDENKPGLGSTCALIGNSDIDSVQSRQSTCYGDTILDFDKNEGNDTNFDSRSYINVACQETDKINSITDMSRKIFKPGNPIDFALNVRGSIKCIAFFDYEQWKIDYAVIPRRDTIRKKRLEYIYYVFNNLNDSNYNVEVDSPSFSAYDYNGSVFYNDISFVGTNYGTIDWTEKKYNSDNIITNSVVNEVLVDKKTRTTNEDPLTIKTGIITTTNSPIDLYSGEYKAYDASRLSGKKLYSVEDFGNVVMTSHGNSILQGYEFTSNANMTYNFKKYCVDYAGNIVEAPEVGLCANGQPGLNKYYISYSAKGLDKFKAEDFQHGDFFTTNVKINTSIPQKGVCSDSSCSSSEGIPKPLSYENNNVCKYAVMDNTDNRGYSCQIICSGDRPLGESNYIKKMDIQMRTLKDGYTFYTPNKAISIKSKYRNYSSADVTNTVYGFYKRINDLSSTNKYGFETYEIKGVVYDDKNVPHYCTNTCSYVKSTPSCTISKIDSNKFEIIPGGGASSVSAIVVNDAIDKDDLIEIAPDSKGKYILTLEDEVFETGELNVVGHVSDGSSGDVCPYKEPSYNCTAEYCPGEYTKIREHCDNYASDDIHDYDDAQDCFDKCSPCPDGIEPVEDTKEKIKTNISIIKDQYCDKHWEEFLYPSKDECINLTYERCVSSEKKTPYIYRPVNVNNPFPSAVESSVGYISGSRPIGINWQGQQQNITNTYVTNDAPDYFVSLDPSTINSIKKKIESLEKAGAENIYIKEKPLDETDLRKKYISDFIHREFCQSFAYIDGKFIESGEGCKK